MDIRQQIVEDQVEKLNDNLGLDDVNKAFQVFSHSLFTDNSVHSYDTNDDVDGGQDKQIDNITIEQKDGEGIIIIDDLVDSGKTLEVVRELYPKAHYATVYAKAKGRPLVDTFITEVSQDTWIFFPWDMALQYVEPYRDNE